ncbi:MAG TPA: hypothetical protein VHE60_01535 [Pyrinomonadaceae bacterium]|nr:hypothetical protein [Pyrinomonadaceae bacterium]
MNQQLKRTLLSLAGLGVFLLLALGSLPASNENNSNQNSNRRSNPNTITYHNSSEQFTGQLADNYVDFSFDYPNSWKRDPEAGTSSDPSFVKVEKTASNGFENFAVAPCWALRDELPQLAGRTSDQFSGGFPEYKKVSEGEIRIGSYDGYEFRFTSRIKPGQGRVWGRVVLLPGTGARKGATLILLAMSASSDVHGPEDVGEKGELPGILDSFRFGP